MDGMERKIPRAAHLSVGEGDAGGEGEMVAHRQSRCPAEGRCRGGSRGRDSHAAKPSTSGGGGR